MDLLTICNRNIPYVFQDERYACSGDYFVQFLCTRVYRFCYFAVSSAPAAIKMAANFFLHGDHKSSSVGNASP